MTCTCISSSPKICLFIMYGITLRSIISETKQMTSGTLVTYCEKSSVSLITVHRAVHVVVRDMSEHPTIL